VFQHASMHSAVAFSDDLAQRRRIELLSSCHPGRDVALASSAKFVDFAGPTKGLTGSHDGAVIGSAAHRVLSARLR
jgi:hypothetical protein